MSGFAGFMRGACCGVWEAAIVFLGCSLFGLAAFTLTISNHEDGSGFRVRGLGLGFRV